MEKDKAIYKSIIENVIDTLPKGFWSNTIKISPAALKRAFEERDPEFLQVFKNYMEKQAAEYKIQISQLTGEKERVEEQVKGLEKEKLDLTTKVKNYEETKVPELTREIDNLKKQIEDPEIGYERKISKLQTALKQEQDSYKLMKEQFRPIFDGFVTLYSLDALDSMAGGLYEKGGDLYEKGGKTILLESIEARIRVLNREESEKLEESIRQEEESIKQAINEDLEGAEVIGKVTNYFSKKGVAAITLDKHLKVGEEICIKGETTYLPRTVESMEIDHNKVTEASPGDNVGVLVKAKVRKNDTAYRMV